ncbi:hypothetical protein GCM10023147_45950 [Tsukamurella soli]|uniref:Uncharacterized protein n=2 Tax=Tsukamurella soli TaxID=644556 RepID=A0ABP8KD42_9ACTN
MFLPGRDGLKHGNEYFFHTSGLPMYVVIAYDSDYAPSTLRDKLSAIPPAQVHPGRQQHGVQPQPPIDVVCVLGKYVAWNLRDVPGPMEIKDEHGIPCRGWIVAETEAPLAWALTWLQLMTPRIERGAPIFRWYLGQRAWMPAGDGEPDG